MRVRAVVDTVSTRNLVAYSLVQSLRVPVGPSNVAILAIGGKPFNVVGEVSLILSRIDKLIHLPRTATDLVVVDNLDYECRYFAWCPADLGSWRSGRAI